MLSLNPRFLIFKLLDAPHLILKLCNLVLERLLLLLKGLRYLLLQSSLSLDDFVPDFVEDLAYLAPVLVC